MKKVATFFGNLEFFLENMLGIMLKHRLVSIIILLTLIYVLTYFNKN